MNAKLIKALKIISNSLLVLVLILAILLVGLKFVGMDILIVLSPSMEPKYPTGSLIYLVDVDPSTLKVNDVITYRLSSTATATHRIMEIIPGGKLIDKITTYDEYLESDEMARKRQVYTTDNRDEDN